MRAEKKRGGEKKKGEARGLSAKGRLKGGKRRSDLDVRR